jgi:hypothetical protein
MKKTINIILAFSAFLLCSCNFSTGSKKDFGTGLSVSYKGFAIGDTYMVGGDNTAVTSGDVDMNTRVGIVIEGIENYELKDGKAFPGLSLNVMDSQGNAVIDEKDLLNNAEGYDPVDAAILRGTVTVGSPMKSGEKYDVRMRVWDKNKPESEIVAEVELTVK